MNERHHTIAIFLFSLFILGNGFTTPLSGLQKSYQTSFDLHSGRSSVESVVMAATGKRKRKRKRKQPPGAPTPQSIDTTSIDPPVVSSETASIPMNTPQPAVEDNLKTLDDIDGEEKVDISQIADVANFQFVPEEDASSDDGTIDESGMDENPSGEPIPLPDIKQVLQKKAMEQLAKAEEEENEENKIKINRKDKKALVKLLEQQPYADADDSFFEEEEYGTVSALLGERAKPFLGIPTGPLQVGHFIGALVIVLMAFVEYPGFPLTNLPSALRGALQGGLFTVYAINAVLAVLAVFKAGERGQPAGLWVAKTLSVGGLAYDQLTQLPTLEQIEKVKSRKGARALKNKKKYQ